MFDSTHLKDNCIHPCERMGDNMMKLYHVEKRHQVLSFFSENSTPTMSRLRQQSAFVSWYPRFVKVLD